MSTPGAETAPIDVDVDRHTPMLPAPQPRYKSWRKKYRKLKLRFDDEMEEANDMFVREHNAWDIAKRMQEQNDQLLDILYDLEIETSREDASNLFSFRQSLLQNVENLSSSTTHTEPALLAALLPGTTPSDILDLPSELRHNSTSSLLDDLPPGYLTTTHEDSYLSTLDASLTALPSTDNLPHTLEAIHPSSAPAREKTVVTQGDFAYQSPISVHNWLRRNKPDMYIEKGTGGDKDKSHAHLLEKVTASSDRSGGRSPAPEAGGSGKKGKKGTAMATKAEKEREALERMRDSDGLDEEIGSDVNLGSTTLGLGSGAINGGSVKGKRKRDDDTYRPKGGNSRPAKRKKERDREKRERSKMDSVVKAEDLEDEDDGSENALMEIEETAVGIETEQGDKVETPNG